ncbi:hypothetical protein TWF694_004614 [Orbilia ellipsospora]|uniref:Uncharacterized protein n=1 Tax=Orbilia ellipsospora TaxID=2528407 RepID=A0AAV9WVM2_9PEZI
MNPESSTGPHRRRQGRVESRRGKHRFSVLNIRCGESIQIPEAQMSFNCNDDVTCLEIRYGSDTTNRRAVILLGALVRQLDTNGTIGVTPRGVAHHKLQEYRDTISHSTLTYEHENLSELPFKVSSIYSLYHEWVITLKSPITLFYLKLHTDKGGWVCRLMRQYLYSPPPVEDTVTFEEPQITSGPVQLFRLDLPERKLGEEEMATFRDWCLMTKEDTQGLIVPVPRHVIG